MNKKTISLLLITLLIGLSACNAVNFKRNSNLQDSLLHYKIMMNRSDFVAAARFRMPTARWNTRGLELYQLTHYEVKQSESKEDGNRLEQAVLLRYLNRHNMRERSMLHKEIWLYNTESKQWLLDGKPPVFK